jgi:ABC-2 type transport system ATP-binding protein
VEDSILIFRDVSKSYGDVRALEDVSLTLAAGEKVALLGPNGSGKSTLVNLALGLLRPHAGQVWLFGQNPKSSLSARSRMGVMLQSAAIPPTLRVSETVELFRSYYRDPLPVADALHLAGLEGLEKRWYARLSGGQQRRVQFALAICGNPELLVLDEPTAGLDPDYRRAFWETLHVWAGRGKTLLFTTHYLDEADRWAERVVVLHKGRVRADGSVQRVKSQVAAKVIRFRSLIQPRIFENLPGILQASSVGEYLELAAERPEAVIPQILAIDPMLRDLEVREAALEEVFHELIREQA